MHETVRGTNKKRSGKLAEHRDKKPGSRRAYLKDFKTDDSGRYSYQGKTLHSSRELSSYQKEIRTALTVFAAVLAAQLAAGCIPGTGMEGHVLMLLPYALEIGCTVRILWIFCTRRLRKSWTDISWLRRSCLFLRQLTL